MSDENNLDINIGINPAGAEAGARRTSAAVGSVVTNTKDLDSAFRRLKSAIDPTYAATDRYNKSMAEYNSLLKAGKIDQAEYAKYMDVLKRAYDSQISSIERNGSAAKQAAADKKQALVQEAKDRETAAAQQKQIADEWVAQERRNTQLIKAELAQRTLAQKAAIAEAAAAAREAAAASVAATRGGGATVTKAAETAQIREAAQAAKQAARERVQAEQQADEEIKAAYAETVASAKALSAEAASDYKAATAARVTAEMEAADAILAVDKALTREATQAAREAAAGAAAVAKDRVVGEKELAGQLKQRSIAEEQAAIAAAKDAKALNDMRMSIDPAFAAQERYNSTMQKATQLLMQNVLAEGEWITIQKQAAIQQDINTRSMGRANQVGIQLGYQMQDVTASIASGINPLVIFAQQSGQVAYAMQGMGGAAGTFAGILGGIWFQAVLGAVVILSKLWEEHDKGKKKTLDLMDAESRRTATLKELTQALDQYTRSQHAANLETEAAHRLTLQQLVDDQNEINKKWADANKKLIAAQAILKDMQDHPAAMGDDSEAAAGALTGQLLVVHNLQTAVDNLRVAHDKAANAAAEGAISAAKAISQETQTTIIHGRAVDAITAAYYKSKRSAQDYQTMLASLRVEETKYAAAKAAESAATRQEAALEAGVYKSRLDAINTAAAALQKAGFSIPKDHANPNKIGNHPGMGNAAHADHALDVNIPGGGTEANNPIYKKKMDDMVKQYQAAGFRILWNGKVYNPSGQGASYDIPANQNQHRDHVHIEAPADLVGKPKGMGLAKGIAAAEDKAIKDLETAEMKAANALAEVIDTKEKALAQDDTKTNGEKLMAVTAMEAQRVAIITKAYGESSKQAEEAKQHELNEIKRYNDLIIKEESARADRVKALGTVKENQSFARDQNKTGMQSDEVDFQANNSLITEKQAVGARRAILDQEYQDQVTHEMAMAQLADTALQKKLELPNQDKEHIDAINEQIEQGQAEHLARMDVLQQQYARGVAKSQRDAAQITLTQWKSVADGLTSSFSQGLQGIWMKTQTVGGALLNMADQMVFKFMDMGVKMLNDWIMNQIKMTFFQRGQQAARTGISATAAATEKGIQTATTAAAVAGQAAKTGAAVAGAAAQTGVAATAGVSEITTNAAVSAAGAFKSTVVIPFIGPVAAPAAAALALAAVLGFASLISAEGGMGEVDRDQLAMVHKKEMILPAWIAEPMRQNLMTPSSAGIFGGASSAGAAARSVGGGGDNYDFHYGPQHTNMNADMASMLRKDGQAMRKWIRNEVRNGTLKLKG